MKTGKSLQELAAELDAIKRGSRDYVAPAPLLRMTPEKQLVMQTNGDTRPYDVRPYAHGQIAGLLGIPKAYYDRMAADAPALLANNVNAWLSRRTDDKQLVRTIGTDVRAVLSDRFRALDNVDLAEAALPELINKGAVVQSVQLTETRFYLKATLPTMRRALGGGTLPVGAEIATYDQIPNYEARKAENLRRGFKVGDVVEAMICLSNSEVGAGTLKIEWGTMVLACLNALIVPGDSYKRYHIGRSQAAADDDQIRALISNEARQADDRAFWLKVRDMVRLSFDETRFNALVGKLEGAQADKIDARISPVQVVERAVERFSFSESVGGSVLSHLIAGGDLSRYGLSQAITRASADVDDYDTATELERVGGQVIELPPRDWEKLAIAA